MERLQFLIGRVIGDVKQYFTLTGTAFYQACARNVECLMIEQRLPYSRILYLHV